MSDKTFSLFDPAIHRPVYNVEVCGDGLTGGLTDAAQSQRCEHLESVVVWRNPAPARVVLTFDYYDGGTHDLTHRWFHLSFCKPADWPPLCSTPPRPRTSEPLISREKFREFLDELWAGTKELARARWEVLTPPCLAEGTPPVTH